MMRQALAKLEHEPRDAGWASAVEQQIRDYLEAKQPGENPIRALECRTSICAIECTAPDWKLCHLEYEFTKRVGLLEHGNASSFETDKSGARIDVTVEAFERREPRK